MAKHTITIINRGGDGSKSKTSATTNKKKSGVSGKNKQNLSFGKKGLGKGLKAAGGLAYVYAAIKATKIGVNIYASVNSAATGEELNNNNLLAFANAFFNPVGFAKDVVVQNVLGNLVVQRQNRALEYQRQLTGNLSFSKNFNDGTF